MTGASLFIAGNDEILLFKKVCFIVKVYMHELKRVKFKWSVHDIQMNKNQALVSIKFIGAGQEFYNGFLFSFVEKITFEQIESAVNDFLENKVTHKDSVELLQQLKDEGAEYETEVIIPEVDKISFKGGE